MANIASQVSFGRYILGKYGIYIQSINEKEVRIELGTF